MTTKFKELRERVRRHGFWNTLCAIALLLINKVFVLRIFRGLYVEQPNPSFFKCPSGLTAGFLSAPQLREYARDPGNQMRDTFIDAALPRGHECHAIREVETLAAYGWYATGTTRVGIADLEIAFDSRYVYMYKGFTVPRFRGRRLYAIGMTRALRHYKNRGYQGLVNYVEAQNAASLKSCLRMGYRMFGSIYLIGVFGKYFSFCSPGCERFDFRLIHRPSGTPAFTIGKTVSEKRRAPSEPSRSGAAATARSTG